MEQLLMSSPSIARRFLKLVAVFVGTLIALVIVVKMGIGLSGTQVEQIDALNAVSNSSFVVWIRFGIYGLLIAFWKPLLLAFSPKLSDKTISATRRPLIVTIVLCELFLVRNIVSFLLN
jgi:hypothetical protein